MIVPIRTRIKTVFKIDDLFRRGDIFLDKENDVVFFYRPEVHKENVYRNPNNYRIAHKGDMKHVRMTFKHRLMVHWYKFKYWAEDFISKGVEPFSTK